MLTGPSGKLPGHASNALEDQSERQKMSLNWVSNLVRRNVRLDPFEAADVEPSPFLRKLVLDVQKACEERDFEVVLKLMFDSGLGGMTDADRQVAARNNHAKYIHGPLTEVDILDHGRQGQRLEYAHVCFYGRSPSLGTRYLGVAVHHRSSGPLTAWWQFGGDFSASRYR